LFEITGGLWFKSGLGAGLFHYSTFIILPYLLGQDLFRFLWLWVTGKVDNNTGRIPPLAGLSRFDHQVWHLASIWVACGSSQALKQVFFITPRLLSCLIY